MPDNRFYRNASEQLRFEMSQVPPDGYLELCNKIRIAFSLSPVDNSLVHGLDEVFQDFRKEELVVQIAWDIWTGFTITSLAPDSETLVREIAEWLLQIQMA